MAIALVYETHSTPSRQRDWTSRRLARGPARRSWAASRRAELGERRRDDGLAAVFTSDLGRAIETAEIAFAGSDAPGSSRLAAPRVQLGELNGARSPRSTMPGAAANRRALRGRRDYRQVVERTRTFLQRPRSPSSTARACLLIAHSANRWALQHLLLGSGARGASSGRRSTGRKAGSTRSPASCRRRARLLVWPRRPRCHGLRASARAAAAADRVGRRGGAGGACGDARQALDQARGEAVRARPRGPDDGSDDARGRGHARQGRRDLLEGDPARPADPTVPSVAAVCVYPNLVPTAVERTRGTSVKVASVATAFPSGQTPTDVKVAEVREVVEMGADEVDMVIDRGAFLSGRYAKVYDEIVQVKEAARRRAPEGDPRDRRARHLRQRAPREPARDRWRRRLHQDVDGQAAVRRRRCR